MVEERRWHWWRGLLLYGSLTLICLAGFFASYIYFYNRYAPTNRTTDLVVQETPDDSGVARAAELSGALVTINGEDNILTASKYGLVFDFPSSWTAYTGDKSKVSWRLTGTGRSEPADLEMQLVKTNGVADIFPKYLVDASASTQTIDLINNPFEGYKYTSTSSGRWLRYAFELKQPVNEYPWVIFTFRADSQNTSAIQSALTKGLEITE